MVPGEIIGEWFALEDTVNGVGVFKLPDRATVMVVEWVETDATDFDQYEEMKGQIAQQIADSRMREAISDWFNPDQIRARNGFELVGN